MDLSELDSFIYTLAESHQLEKYLNHEGRVSLPFLNQKFDKQNIEITQISRKLFRNFQIFALKLETGEKKENNREWNGAACDDHTLQTQNKNWENWNYLNSKKEIFW